MNRYFLKSGLTKFLLAILIVAFVLSSISGILFMTNKYDIININGRKININEFIKVVNIEKQRFYYENQTNQKNDFLNSKEFLFITLDKTLKDYLIKEEIKDYKFTKPEKLVLSKIVKEKFFNTNGKFDVAKFKNFLKMYNFTENQYITLVRDQETNLMFFSTFINNIEINNNYFNNIFDFHNAYKNITLFNINKNKIKLKDVKISADEIKHYYNNNINKFILPEQRKVDYIKITNYNQGDIEKLEELLLVSENIGEIAANINVKVETYGYINQNTNIKNIDDIFTFSINDFSNIKKIDNNLFVYSVVDIKKEYTKTMEEAKKDIISLITEEHKEKQYADVVAEYIEKYKNSKFNKNILLNNNFAIKNINIYRNSKDFDSNFIENVFKTNDKNITKIFSDESGLYFAYINSTSILDNNDENYTDEDTIKKSLYESVSRSLQENYFDYLKLKYDVKINYKLLNLIN